MVSHPAHWVNFLQIMGTVLIKKKFSAETHNVLFISTSSILREAGVASTKSFQEHVEIMRTASFK